MVTDTFPSGGKSMPVEVFAPPGAGPHPAVVVLYGTRALTAPFGRLIRDYAFDLAGAGAVVLIPDYFVRTGTTAAREPSGDVAVAGSYAVHRDSWASVLDDVGAHGLTWPTTRGQAMSAE